jgi:hypothetical protein
MAFAQPKVFFEGAITLCYHMKLNRKQAKLVESVFAVPTRANITFSDVEKLLTSLGAMKIEGSGSRVGFVMPNGLKWEAHRPHPRKEAKKYQVESLRDFLMKLEMGNE